MVCWSLSAIIGCDTIQQPLVQVKPESMVSLVNINRTLYMHVIKKLGDIDSGKPIIKFVLKLTHSCPCSEKGHRHLQITVLALTRLYSDDHWRFQEHLLPDCVTRPSSRGLYPNEHWIFQEHLSMRWVESNETGQSKYVTRVFCQSFIVSSLYWLFDHFLPCLANS